MIYKYTYIYIYITHNILYIHIHGFTELFSSDDSVMVYFSMHFPRAVAAYGPMENPWLN